MSEPRFHGPELDAAIEAVPDPVTMCERHGLCLTALDSRITGIIDRQLEELQRSPEELRADLAAAGVPFTDDLTVEQLKGLALRSVIGGSFSMGVGTAFELQAEEVRRREQG